MISHIASREPIVESNAFATQLESAAAVVVAAVVDDVDKSSDVAELDSDARADADKMSRFKHEIAALRIDARCADVRCMKNESSSIAANVDDEPYRMLRNAFVNDVRKLFSAISVC